MEPSAPNPQADVIGRLELIERRQKKQFLVLTSTVCVVFVLLLAFAGVVFWNLRKTTASEAQILKSQTDLQFSDAVNDYNRDADFVTINIGVIQFLRRGFSITFDSANYSQDGLTLTGTIGNPMQLWISSLTLNMSVRPYPYQVRAKWDKDKFVFWNTSDFEVGNGQVNVGLLNPGSTASFTITIPNVKQTKDEPEIAVWFSGERYSYLK
ncbi:MAG: hypothetical protein WBD87_07830 [Candidatus Acidiferrales bacterium]